MCKEGLLPSPLTHSVVNQSHPQIVKQHIHQMIRKTMISSHHHAILLLLLVLLVTTAAAVPPEPFTQDQCKKKLKPGQSLSLSSRSAICRTTRSGGIYQFGLVPQNQMASTDKTVDLATTSSLLEKEDQQSKQQKLPSPRECGEKAVCSIPFPDTKPIQTPDIVCLADAQYCGNDVYVGRDPANGCAFKPCPFQFCAGDTFYHPFCMPNHCRCGENGDPGCTKMACTDQCSDNSDCEAVVRSQTAQPDVYPLCQCEARSTNPTIQNKFDQCLGEVDGNCANAKCIENSCQGLKAVCTKDRICALAPSQCPGINEPCMNSENHAACIDLEERGCKSILIMESCPLQFGCDDSDGNVANGEAQQAADPQEDDTISSGTLQLLRVGREGNVQQLWTATNSDGEPAVGNTVQLHEDGNLVLYNTESSSTSSTSVCGGIAGIQCPGDMVCVFTDKNCDPDCGGVDCSGVCAERVDAIDGPFCGGLAGFECPDGAFCVDQKGDSCSPNCFGADCAGLCIIPSSTTSKVDLQTESAGAVPVWETGCAGDSGTRPVVILSNVRTVFKKRQSIVKVVRKLPTSTKDWWVRGDGREVKKCARRR